MVKFCLKYARTVAFGKLLINSIAIDYAKSDSSVNNFAYPVFLLLLLASSVAVEPSQDGVVH